MTVVVNPLANKDFDSLVIEVRLSRVFVFRIWLGVRLLRLAMRVIGGRAEVIASN